MDLFNLEDESFDTEDLCTGELLLATILNTRLVSNSCNFNQCCPVQPHRHNGELPLRHGQFHPLSNPGDGDGGVGGLENVKRELLQYPMEHPEKFF